MELKNIEALKDELNHLEEAENLLHEVYFGLGPYGIRQVLQEHRKEFFPTDVDQLLVKLDRHFNFDDSE
jgi:hypothetical protein